MQVVNNPMVSSRPLRIGLFPLFPFQMAFHFMAERNGGDPITTETNWDDPTLIFQFPIYLEPSSQLPIYQVTRPPGSKYIGNWKMRDPTQVAGFRDYHSGVSRLVHFDSSPSKKL